MKPTKTFILQTPGARTKVIVFCSEQKMRSYDIKLAKYYKFKRKNRRFHATSFLFKDELRPATVLFCYKFLGSGTVAHEMTHVASHVLLWKYGKTRLKITDDLEEQLATMVDDLCRLFWLNYYRHFPK